MFFFIIIFLIIIIIKNNKIYENFTNDELNLIKIINNINKIKFLTREFDFKNNISTIIYNFTRYFENNILINNFYDYKFLKTDKLYVDFEKANIKFNFYINTFKKQGYNFETLIIKNNNDYIIEYIKKIDYIDLSDYILRKPFNYYSRVGEDDDVGKVISINKKNISKILKQKILKKNINKYRCLNSYGESENECERNYDKYGRLKNVGIWDKSCEKNTDCPFYKSNKNYENEYGGCKNGYCEMPLGIKQISFRKYDKNFKPICKDCKNNIIFCCEEQKNKNEYPNLKSPDYLY